MTEIVAFIHHALQGIYPPSEIKSLTRILLEQICGLPPHRQILHKDNELSPMEKEQLRQIVKRLQTGEPVQYILGYTEFRGLQLHVSPSVLIPRPETEELTDRIIRRHSQSNLRILDLGTGSGCIAVALGKFLPLASVTAVDLSPEAIDIARRNADAQKVKIQFIRTDLLKEDETLRILPECFDLIVSNPPYVRESEKAEMEHHVLDYEPSLALFVPDEDPLLFYRSIADFGLRRLHPGGSLYFEINAAYGSALVDLLKQKKYTTVELYRDLSGRDRFIHAIK